MSKIRFTGPFGYRIKSFAILNKIIITTGFRHLFGRRIAPDWDVMFEAGILFWRHQFTTAMRHSDFSEGRLIFDSVLTETNDEYDVTVEPSKSIKGHWYRPAQLKSKATLLYFHGGGYAFHSAISKRFAQMLAHHTGANLFAPDYRLTPEHPHPAQAEDAQAAWDYLSSKVSPENIVVIGDSAGGHMSFMLLQTLKQNSQKQPALCIGLCPWTDIGERGNSLQENDKYDLVQGWMALEFGRWLDPENKFGRKVLSPIYYDYSGLAPIYLQTGGREVLHDMVVEFARVQQKNGANVMLDIWSDVPHNFQAYDSMKLSSSDALEKISQIIDAHVK